MASMLNINPPSTSSSSSASSAPPILPPPSSTTINIISNSASTGSSNNWQNNNQFLWVKKYMDMIDFAWRGNTSRGDACNVTKSVNKGPCSCQPTHEWPLPNIFVDPIDPFISHRDVTPISVQRSRLYFWVPEFSYALYLVHIPCPDCGPQDGHVVWNGWNHNGPRRVCALGREYFILAKQYKCTICKCNFSGLHPQVIKQLPDIIQQRLPAEIYGKTGCDKTFIDIMIRQVVNGQSFSDVRKMYSEINHMEFMRSKFQYLSAQVKEKSTPNVLNYADRLVPIADFGNFFDRDGWRGAVPSLPFLTRTYAIHGRKSQNFKHQHNMGITGDILSGDHTFKIAKVPCSNFERIFDAMFSVMNEFGQIVGYWMVCSKSLKEIMPELTAIKKRYSIGGPLVWYSDQCCQDRGILSSVFPSLKDGVLIKPKFCFEGEIVVSSDSAIIDTLCEEFMKEDCLGFDMEWEVDFESGISQRKTAVLQLCSNSKCLIIQMQHLESISSSLRNILESENIVKTGVNIGNDASKLMRDFQITMKGCYELMDAYSHISGKSLQNLVSVVLGYELDKAACLISPWEDINLDEDAVKYAAADAFASLRLYQVHMTGEAVMKPAGTSNNLQYERVLLDAFHFLDRYPVQKNHALYAPFMAFLRDGLFINDSDDLEKAKQILRKRMVTEADIKKLSLSYYVQKSAIRRYIPPACEVAKRINLVVETFREISPTFINAKVMKVHKSCMVHLKGGCLSDHPDVPLYFQMGSESDEVFQKLKCARGSSQGEGFHLHVRSAIAASVVSPVLFDYMLTDMVFRWNIDRGITCKLYSSYGCYDILMWQKIHGLYSDNLQFFKEHPLKNYKPLPDIADNALERFGCSRIYDDTAVQTILKINDPVNETEIDEEETSNEDLNQNLLIAEDDVNIDYNTEEMDFAIEKISAAVPSFTLCVEEFNDDETKKLIINDIGENDVVITMIKKFPYPKEVYRFIAYIIVCSSANQSILGAYIRRGRAFYHSLQTIIGQKSKSDIHMYCRNME